MQTQATEYTNISTGPGHWDSCPFGYQPFRRSHKTIRPTIDHGQQGPKEGSLSRLHFTLPAKTHKNIEDSHDSLCPVPLCETIVLACLVSVLRHPNVPAVAHSEPHSSLHRCLSCVQRNLDTDLLLPRPWACPAWVQRRGTESSHTWVILIGVTIFSVTGHSGREGDVAEGLHV